MQTKTLIELMEIASSDEAEQPYAMKEWMRRVQKALQSIEINLVPAEDDSLLLEYWVHGRRYAEGQMAAPTGDAAVKMAAGIEALLLAGQGLVTALANAMLDAEADHAD